MTASCGGGGGWRKPTRDTAHAAWPRARRMRPPLRESPDAAVRGYSAARGGALASGATQRPSCCRTFFRVSNVAASGICAQRERSGALCGLAVSGGSTRACFIASSSGVVSTVATLLGTYPA